ncbi:hypothetical protein M422DRAFT_261822, partial [Sphaerobolus stellatus SS14]
LKKPGRIWLKPIVWHAVSERLALNHPKEVKKSIERCKSRWQRLKGEYRIVCELCEQSGFGWDEAKQLVTAPHDTWEKYIASHPKAKPFRRKSFPLFDDIASLVDAIVATGAGALHMAGDDEQDEGPLDNIDPVMCSRNGITVGGSDKDGSVSSDTEDIPQTPAASNKCAHNGGPPPGVKRQRQSSSQALFSLSSALETMATAFLPSSSAASSSELDLTTPQCKTKAIRTMEKEEGFSPHGVADAATIFTTCEKHDTYLAFENKEARRIWLEQEMDKVI